MKKKIIHTPDGFRDWLPEEAAVKDWIFEKATAVFEQYNYRRLESPGLEFFEVFDAAATFKGGEGTFTLSDHAGNILALRSDMTPPIARIASTAYKDSGYAQRFYYKGNIYTKTSNLQGKLSESPQAGIELFGVDSSEADAEVVEITIRALEATGIKNFVLHIGHVGFVGGILGESGLSEEEVRNISEMLDRMDYAGISNAVEALPLNSEGKEVLSRLPLLVGGPEMLERYLTTITNPVSKAALERLLRIHTLLAAVGLGNRISFDLGLVNHVDYYTGMMLRAYAQGTGFPVASGGRYDTLTRRFGKDTPSVGVTIKVNNMVDICGEKMKESTQSAQRILLAYAKPAKKQAMQGARALREAGKIVESSFYPEDEEENIRYAKSSGLDRLLFFQTPEIIRLTDIPTGKRKVLSIEELFQYLEVEM